jgi:hypothetical protein
LDLSLPLGWRSTIDWSKRRSSIVPITLEDVGSRLTLALGILAELIEEVTEVILVVVVLTHSILI